MPALRRLPVVLLAALALACGRGAEPATDPAASAAAPVMDPRVARADLDRIRGDSAAPIWVMIVSDFQCPFCAQWEQETSAGFFKEFVETGKVRVAFVNFPLSQHQNARPAAEAAMCAGAQGKFWAMHDRIFAQQATWSVLSMVGDYFDRPAAEVGVDMAAYKQCMGDHAMQALIDVDVDRASKGGANSTPTFFIGDTEKLAGAADLPAMREAIEKEMQRRALSRAR